jgi:hypothetical protein
MYGAMLLQASMSFSVTLARFTLQLNRRPDLTRRIRSVDEDSGGKSVAESSAEIIQKIFTTCLTDRSVGRVPEGKKVGVYMFANLVLKLLFAVRLLLSYMKPQKKTKLLKHDKTKKVPENKPRKDDLCQHINHLAPYIALPGLPARHLPLLPRPLQLLQPALSPRGPVS